MVYTADAGKGIEAKKWIENPVLQLPIELMHDKELQIDGPAIPVFMTNLGYLPAYDCRNPQFFVQLTRQRVFRSLSWFDLATGKLPLQAHGLIRLALADQHLNPGPGLANRFSQNERRHHKPQRLESRYIDMLVQLANGLFHLTTV
jgi:hypothetical protein